MSLNPPLFSITVKWKLKDPRSSQSDADLNQCNGCINVYNQECSYYIDNLLSTAFEPSVTALSWTQIVVLKKSEWKPIFQVAQRITSWLISTCHQ